MGTQQETFSLLIEPSDLSSESSDSARQHIQLVELEERCRRLALELDEERMRSACLHARVASESDRADLAYREKLAAERLVGEQDSRLMELMLRDANFEREQRETQSNACRAEELHAQHQAAFNS